MLGANAQLSAIRTANHKTKYAWTQSASERAMSAQLRKASHPNSVSTRESPVKRHATKINGAKIASDASLHMKIAFLYYPLNYAGRNAANALFSVSRKRMFEI